ncbi:hypothetical protein ACWD7F_26540 [Streptomyces sp. NPDC005122]
MGYNLPYSKNVPIGESLRAWQQVGRPHGNR